MEIGFNLSVKATFGSILLKPVQTCFLKTDKPTLLQELGGDYGLQRFVGNFGAIVFAPVGGYLIGITSSYHLHSKEYSINIEGSMSLRPRKSCLLMDSTAFVYSFVPLALSVDIVFRARCGLLDTV